jgi:AAA domain/SWIM zinc finger
MKAISDYTFTPQPDGSVLVEGGPNTYTLTKNGEGMTCTCPAFAYGHACKHVARWHVLQSPVVLESRLFLPPPPDADSCIRAGVGKNGLHESPPVLPTRTAADLVADASLAAGVRWIVPALLAPGSSTCLYGIGKGGKSTFAAYVMACLASGAPCLGEAVTAQPVLLLDLEQHVTLTRRKFAELNLAPEALARIHIYNGPTFDDLRRLEATIRETGATVLVVDSLSRFLQLDDENDNAAITAAWEHFMAAVVRPTNVSSLTIHHDRKSGGEHGRGMRGGSAYLAAFDVAVHVKRESSDDEHDPRRRLDAVSRYDEANRTIIVRREESGLYSVEGTSTDVRRQALLAAFGPGEEFTIDEVAARLPDMKRRTLIADLDTLYQKGKLSRDGKGVRGDRYRYALPVFVQTEHPRDGTNARITPDPRNPSNDATIGLPLSCKAEPEPCTNRGDAWEP